MTLLAVTAFLTKRSPECLNQLCIVIIADPVHLSGGESSREPRRVPGCFGRHGPLAHRPLSYQSFVDLPNTP